MFGKVFVKVAGMCLVVRSNDVAVNQTSDQAHTSSEEFLDTEANYRVWILVRDMIITYSEKKRKYQFVENFHKLDFNL